PRTIRKAEVDEGEIGSRLGRRARAGESVGDAHGYAGACEGHAVREPVTTRAQIVDDERAGETRGHRAASIDGHGTSSRTLVPPSVPSIQAISPARELARSRMLRMPLPPRATPGGPAPSSVSS